MAQDYKNPFPVEVNRIYLISPAIMYDYTYKVLPTRDAP